MSSPNWQRTVRLLAPARHKYDGLSSDVRADLDHHLEIIAADPSPSPGGLPITQLVRPPHNIHVYRAALWEIHFAVEPRPNAAFEVFVGELIYLMDDLPL